MNSSSGWSLLEKISSLFDTLSAHFDLISFQFLLFSVVAFLWKGLKGINKAGKTRLAEEKNDKNVASHWYNRTYEMGLVEFSHGV